MLHSLLSVGRGSFSNTSNTAPANQPCLVCVCVCVCVGGGGGAEAVTMCDGTHVNMMSYWIEWMRVASLTMSPLPTLMNTDFCLCVCVETG